MAKMSLQKLIGYAVGITFGSMAATYFLSKFDKTTAKHLQNSQEGHENQSDQNKSSQSRY